MPKGKFAFQGSICLLKHHSIFLGGNRPSSNLLQRGLTILVIDISYHISVGIRKKGCLWEQYFLLAITGD